MPAFDPAATRLSCGADVDDLLEQVADGRPPTDPEHQAGCPYCRAALAELGALWAPVQQFATARVHAPAELVERVMRQVRTLTRDAWHGVLGGPRGVTRIAVWVIATVARRAALRVPAVLFATGRAGPGRDGVGVVGRTVVVDLDVVAPYGVDLQELGARVRRVVTSDVARLTGVTVAEGSSRSRSGWRSPGRPRSGTSPSRSASTSPPRSAG